MDSALRVNRARKLLRRACSKARADSRNASKEAEQEAVFVCTGADETYHAVWSGTVSCPPEQGYHPQRQPSSPHQDPLTLCSGPCMKAMLRVPRIILALGCRSSSRVSLLQGRMQRLHSALNCREMLA